MKNDINFSGSKILIVDDISENLKLLGTILSSHKFKISLASNGQMAYDTALNLLPDLIIMDINMPIKDGIEATIMLKENELTANIPVIMVTALHDKDSLVKAFNAGAVDYITKPIDARELVQRVLTHVELKLSRDMLIKKQNQLLELNNTKDKFFSIISHDIRGPFTGTYNLTKLVVEAPELFDRNDCLEVIENIYSSMGAQLHFLENLLDWSRINIGLLEFKPTKIDLIETIQLTLELLKNNYEAKNISVYFDHCKSAIVNLDEFMISSVVRNIISNALKFTPNNGVINIQLIDNYDKYIFKVKDNGIGIKQDNLDKLFKIDINVSTLGTNEEKGSGIGLLLVKEFIEKNGGNIMINSKVGTGTEVIITFPKQFVDIKKDN